MNRITRKSVHLIVFVVMVNLITVSVFAEICGVVNTDQDSLNIRKEANQTAEVIGYAVRGSVVRILDTHLNTNLDIDKTWYQVILNNGKVGYGSKNYIKTLTPQSSEVCGIVITRESPLNIRFHPDTTSEVIDKVSKNSALRISETNGNWYQVMLNHLDKDGNIILGYASRDYVLVINGIPKK